VIVIFVKMGALANCTFILFSDLGKIRQNAGHIMLLALASFVKSCAKRTVASLWAEMELLYGSYHVTVA